MDKKTEKLTPELIEAATKCSNQDELLALAKENNMEITTEEAEKAFASLHQAEGELSDDELETVAGGTIWKSIGGKDRRLKSLVSECTVEYGGEDGLWRCEDCGMPLREEGSRCVGGGNYCYHHADVAVPKCSWCKFLEYTHGGWYCMNDRNSK